MNILIYIIIAVSPSVGPSLAGGQFFLTLGFLLSNLMQFANVPSRGVLDMNYPITIFGCKLKTTSLSVHSWRPVLEFLAR